MPEITFAIKGTNRVRNQLRRAASDFKTFTDQVIGEWASGLRRLLKAKPYPPKRPGQTYRRTGNLANGWSARRIKVGSWTLVNNVSYATYVVGDAKGVGVAWMHKDRWWKAAAVFEENRRALVRALTEALEELTGGIS